MRYSWMNPKLEIRDSPQGGRGVFAAQWITANEMLFVMGGYILTIEDDNELVGEVSDKAIEISEYFSIGPRAEKDLELMPQHFVNHSCEPNAGFKGQIMLVAMREIHAGEEVIFDYAMVLHPSPGCQPYRMTCRCGVPHCRGMVTDEDWRLPELQRRYEGWFSWYLQEKIVDSLSGGRDQPLLGDRK